MFLLFHEKSLVLEPEKQSQFRSYHWFVALLARVGLLNAPLQRSGIQLEHLVLICFLQIASRVNRAPRVVGICPQNSEACQSLCCLSGCLFECYKYPVSCLTPTVHTINVAIYMVFLGVSARAVGPGRTRCLGD